jgi:NAD(P)-dependent dehydrogenase (short-subunit alcohol dehydrogenase family)
VPDTRIALVTGATAGLGRAAAAALAAQGIALIDIENGDLTTAPLLPGRLRSADAIHLTTALRLNARAMVVYEAELRAASRTAGIEAFSPGEA